MEPQLSTYAWASALGAALGTAELMGRYRDGPVEVFRCFYSWVYVALNACLAGISLFLIHRLGFSIQVEDGSLANTQAAAEVYNILFAGFGGAAFFRSSFMKVKSGADDVAIGPAIVIETWLRVTDREVDRYRALQRAEFIAKITEGVNLGQARDLIVPVCKALMQNVRASEREDLDQVANLLARDHETAPLTKPMILGLKLANIVGFDVLDKVVMSLRERGILPAAISDTAASTWDFVRDTFEQVRSGAGRKGAVQPDAAPQGAKKAD